MNEVLINANENRGSSLPVISARERETFKGPLARYLVLLTKNRKTSWVAVTVRARPINHRLIAFPHAPYVFVSPFHHRRPNGYRSTDPPNSEPRSRPSPPSSLFLILAPISDRISFRSIVSRSRTVSLRAIFSPSISRNVNRGRMINRKKMNRAFAQFELSVGDCIDLSWTRLLG